MAGRKGVTGNAGFDTYCSRGRPHEQRRVDRTSLGYFLRGRRCLGPSRHANSWPFEHFSKVTRNVGSADSRPVTSLVAHSVRNFRQYGHGLCGCRGECDRDMAGESNSSSEETDAGGGAARGPAATGRLMTGSRRKPAPGPLDGVWPDGVDPAFRVNCAAAATTAAKMR